VVSVRSEKNIFFEKLGKMILYHADCRYLQFFVSPNINKKSDLMLMRCARAYGSYCSQVILLCLHPFHCSSLFCSQNSPKNHLKLIFLKFKVINVGIPKKLVNSLVMVSNMSVPICNHFHARQANGG